MILYVHATVVVELIVKLVPYGNNLSPIVGVVTSLTCCICKHCLTCLSLTTKIVFGEVGILIVILFPLVYPKVPVCG